MRRPHRRGTPKRPRHRAGSKSIFLAFGVAVLVTVALAGCSAGTHVGAPRSSSSTTSTTTKAHRSSTTTTTTTTSPVVTSTTGPPSVSTVPPAPPATSSPATSTSTTAVPPGLSGRVWTTIPTTSHVVALTFDAGANGNGLPSILSTLRATGSPATFFLTGTFAQKFPTLSTQIASGGYRLGNHSVGHPYFTHLNDDQVRAEVLDAAASIRAVTGVDPAPLFRFPYGDYDLRTLADVNRLGYVAVGWTVDTLGWKGTSGGITTSSIVARVMASLRPGEIVLMHVGSNPTDGSTLDAAALPTVIAAVHQAGYSFVTMSALLGS